MILGYCRVSDPSQAGPDKTSMDSQETTIHGFAQMRGHTKFDVQIFRDAGVSGALKFKSRPGGDDLMKLVKPGDTVVASKLDRMFRSSVDALTVAEEFKAAGIHLVLLDLGTEPITGGGIAHFVFTMLAAVANMERERIKERCGEGRKAKRAKGGAIAHAPFGYRKVGERASATLLRDEREQAIIAFAKAREKTHTLRQISAELSEAGYLSRTGKPFHAFAISNILEQETVQ
jgi:DNA invertase Pin-like site-specific DNA recombinase